MIIDIDSHPNWDRVWASACELGMPHMLHTGFKRMHFDPAWASVEGGTTLLRMIGGAHRHVAPTGLHRAYGLLRGVAAHAL